MTDAKTRLPGISLRSAVRDDVPQILKFIIELADFENLTHEVVATESALEATLFGEQPAAEVIIVEDEGGPVGFALFFTTYSTFLARPGMYLEDLYVTPSARGQGIGTMLLAYLARLSIERGYGRFEWAVLNWNERAINVYRGAGAESLDEWTGQRITGDALLALARRFDDDYDS